MPRTIKPNPQSVPAQESREQKETGEPKGEIQIWAKGAADWVQASRECRLNGCGHVYLEITRY